MVTKPWYVKKPIGSLRTSKKSLSSVKRTGLASFWFRTSSRLGDLLKLVLPLDRKSGNRAAGGDRLDWELGSLGAQDGAGLWKGWPSRP
jgi:hypothetical protein